MSLGHGPKIITNGLVFAYDMSPIVNGRPISKSWMGAPTFNASLQDGQNNVSPWSGDGSPTSLGIDPSIRFRGRKVAKFQIGTSRNCYINGAGDLSTGTTSTVWTSTFYLKRVDGAALTSVGMYQYITNNTNVNTTVNVTPVEDGWYQAVYTRSGLVAGYPVLTGMFSLGATGDQYYFADWQCENNSFSTPWVSGTRSNTQALLDWTGNRTITANDLTYNSNNTFSFDGSNDDLTISSIDFPTEQTIEIWLKPTENDGVRRNPYNQAYGGYGTWTHETNGTINYYYGDGGGNTTPYIGHNSSFTVAQDEIACVCTTRNTSQSFWYKNGVQSTSYTHSFGELTTHTASITIGTGYAGRYFGDIYAVKLYNRALTATEVAQNFNALKGRYGL